MIITKNGSHYLRPDSVGKSSGSSVVLVSGVMGTASATITYKNDDGDHIPLVDGIVIAPDEFFVEHGVGMAVFLTVTGADAATRILVKVTTKV